MNSRSREKSWPIWVILGVALGLRVVNTISIGDDFYANFLSDASTYKLWATKIVAGSSYLGPAFPMGPLYPYFLALCLNLGFSFYSVLFLQGVFGTVVVFNVYLIAKRVFDTKAGLIAAIMAAIYGPFIFYDGLLLSESLQLLLLSSALVLIIPKRKKNINLIYYFISGILIGLTALGRGTILLFPFFVAVFWIHKYFNAEKNRRMRLLKRTALIVVGTICGILPATIHNISNGEMVPISSNFGINFYIGNNPQATGAYNEPSGLNLSSDFTGKEIAERGAGRDLKSSEVSEFWFDRASDFIKNDPLEFIAGLTKKTWLYFWNFHIPQAESIQIHHKFSPFFYIFPTGYWFVLIPGLIGIFMIPNNGSKWILILLLISSVAGGVIFFVIGRFKLIGSIALLVFAGEGIRLGYQYVKEKNRRRLIKILFVTVFSFLLLFLPRPIDIDYKIASAYDNVGISYFFKNKPDKAIDWYKKAIDIKPGHSGALNNIGGYYYSRKMPDSAIHYFHKSIESDSTNDKTYQNLGRTFLNMGKMDSARYYYQIAKTHSPYGLDADKALRELERLTSDESSATGDKQSFDALYGLAERYAAQRRFSQAESYYERALKLRPDDIKALNNLGFAYQAQGKFDEAIEMFNRVIELSAGNAIIYNNLAGALYGKGELDSAEVLWQKALKLDPDNQQIKKNLDFLRNSRNK